MKKRAQKFLSGRIWVLALVLPLFFVPSVMVSQSISAEPLADRLIQRTVTETVIRVRDGRELKAVVSVPVSVGTTLLPVVINVHGGTGDRSSKFLRRFATPDSDSPIVQAMNAQPMIIVSADFRDEWLGAEEEDIVDALRFALQLPNADLKRVILVGHSNGGRLALRAATLESGAVRCVIASSPFLTDPETTFFGDFSGAPWTDLSAGARKWLLDSRDGLLPLVRSVAVRDSVTLESLVALRSTQRHVGKLKSRVLIFTSYADETVPHQFVQGTIDALAAAGNRAEVLTLRDSDHGFFWFRDQDPEARRPRPPKSEAQRAEESLVRERALAFIADCAELPVGVR
jgi:dipeptidyl aminopeptidase/acylaminoacyl peptidase